MKWLCGDHTHVVCVGILLDWSQAWQSPSFIIDGWCGNQSTTADIAGQWGQLLLIATNRIPLVVMGHITVLSAWTIGRGNRYSWWLSASLTSSRMGINSSPPSAHYSDVIMGVIVSQITASRLFTQRKHLSSAPLAFVRGIHQGPVNSLHKWPITRKMFPIDHIIMPHICVNELSQHWFR